MRTWVGKALAALVVFVGLSSIASASCVDTGYSGCESDHVYYRVVICGSVNSYQIHYIPLQSC